MKDNFCAYFTNSDYINAYMVGKLEVSDGDVILEPSAGEGVFIDSLLRTKKNISVDVLEVNPESIKVLETKYKNCTEVKEIRQTDTLLDESLDFYYKIGGYYNKVIGNPPYGAWQEESKRKLLKKKYSGFYVKETYSLFLLRAISVLKNQGILTFIIPDTFLFLNMHRKLREYLLTETKIKEILIFPSKFFPGVSFGYSNLSIITVERVFEKEAAKNNEIAIYRGFKSVEELPDVLDNIFPESVEKFILKQEDVLNNTDSRFLLDKIIDDSCCTALSKLGDIADVVTGFYTGDNLRFIRARDKNVKGSKKYDVVEIDQISTKADLTGILEPNKLFIPFIKSSSKTRYLRTSDDWFVMWDKDTIGLYNSNKKSRFQNSGYYFKKGIAIPMVKSSSIKATVMEDRVFDQSIVGIFPKDYKYFNYLLAFMNSDLACNQLHTINPTANNSANYVKLIPIKIPQENELAFVDEAVEQLFSAINSKDTVKIAELEKKLNEYFV